MLVCAVSLMYSAGSYFILAAYIQVIIFTKYRQYLGIGKSSADNFNTVSYIYHYVRLIVRNTLLINQRLFCENNWPIWKLFELDNPVLLLSVELYFACMLYRQARLFSVLSVLENKLVFKKHSFKQTAASYLGVFITRFEGYSWRSAPERQSFLVSVHCLLDKSECG